jgi:hypothetical protein
MSEWHQCPVRLLMTYAAIHGLCLLIALLLLP